MFGGNNLNCKKLLTFTASVVLSLGVAANTTSVAFAADSNSNKSTVSESTNVKKKKTTPAQVTTSYDLMTKVAGNKNYKVWKSVNNGKPVGKVADGINFRYNHIQSNQSIKTKKYTYWLIYVDGRRVGWVNERFFARNEIAVPKTVSLVNNENYLFDTRDAISYATDDTGTVVDNDEVSVSKDGVDCTDPKTYNVKYTYGKAKATVKITVRKSTSEGIGNADAVTPKEGTNSLKSPDSHYGSSLNYINPKEFTPEKKTHSWSSDDLTLKTRLFQPVLLSVKTDTNNDGNINRVGHIPEGLTVSNGWAYTSLLSHTNLIQGHIVGYNLNKLVSPYNPQNLLTMSQSKFNTYVKNIKVSPYIPIGHGQAMGSTKNYIYVLVNDNTEQTSNKSEELVQIRKSDMLINKIWTIKCWNGNENSPRYFKNAVITSDKQMYGLYYDKTTDRYEYWELNRTGDNWYPTLVGATKGKFVDNDSPIQGFSYDTKNKNFYLGFNDLIVKVGRDGELKKSYTFSTGREIEGISISDERLYVNLAPRAELLESQSKLN